jgi:hypothetical protein
VLLTIVWSVGDEGDVMVNEIHQMNSEQLKVMLMMMSVDDDYQHTCYLRLYNVFDGPSSSSIRPMFSRI